MEPLRPEVNELPYCYLTTRGRRSGNPHTIEIWFDLDGTTLLMLAGSGEKADYVRNLRADPKVELRLDDVTYSATGRVITDPEEEQRARTMLVAKYQPGYKNDLTNWGQKALPIAIDLDVEQ